MTLLMAQFGFGGGGSSELGFAFISGGGQQNSPYAVTYAPWKYTYSSDTITKATNLMSYYSIGMAGAGNKDVAYFSGGNYYFPDVAYYQVNTAWLANYSSEAVNTTTALGAGAVIHAEGFGSNSVAYSTGGLFYTSSAIFSFQSKTSKYTYSSATSVSSTALGTAKYNMGTSCNNDISYVAGGVAASGSNQQLSAVEIFTFSNDSRTSGTSMSVVSQGLMGTGIQSSGYFGGGLQSNSPGVSRSTIYRITYSSGTWSLMSGALSANQYNGAAFGTKSKGYFNTMGTSTTSGTVYTYASDSSSAGGYRTLYTTYNISDPCSTGSCPAGF